MIIRDARPDDVDALVDGNLRLAAETEDHHLDPDRLRRGIAALLADPAKGWYLVAELDGQVIGQVMITSEWSDWRNGAIWWLQSVYVPPEHRRRGVLKALHAKVVEIAQEVGDVVAIRLYVEAGNEAAQAAYQRLGLVSAGYDVWHQPLPPS